MSKFEDAQKVLKGLGLPPAQQNDISCYTLLALCGLKSKDHWKNSSRTSLTVTKGIMVFIESNYGKKYAPNTRETFRRQVLHQFVQAHVVEYNPDDPNLPTNSPRAHYALSTAALKAIHAFGTVKWKAASEKFVRNKGSLLALYRKERKKYRVPVQLPTGNKLTLSPGKHNEVQAAVVELFAPQFVPSSRVLYLGDTEQKTLVVDTDRLESLGIPLTEHDKLPDVVLFDEKRNWLVLVEAVTSHGPMSPKRVQELETMLSKCPAGPVYVSAFPDMAEFRKHLANIAWETEVWIVEISDHIIHFNGERFLGPY